MNKLPRHRKWLSWWNQASFKHSHWHKRKKQEDIHAYTCGNDGNHTETVKFLPDKGADVNAQDDDGDTIALAISGGNSEITRLLLDKGVDIIVKRWDGFAPLR